METFVMPAPTGIHTRMGSSVTILGAGSKPGWIKVRRHSDGSIREFHELDLRAPGGLKEIQDTMQNAVSAAA